MKSRILLLVLLALAATSTLAQEQPVAESTATPPPAQVTTSAARPIRVWSDGASYLYFQDTTKSYVEVYVALQRKDIQFEDMTGYFQGKVYLYLEAMDQTGKMIDSLGKWVPITVQHLEDAYKDDIRIFEVIPCLLTPDHYKMRLTAIDGISKRTGIATFDLEVKNYATTNLSMSDLELAYDIAPVETDSVYSALIKSNRKVIPNPNKYISNEDTLLYYYAEVYNLAQREGASNEFEVKSTLLDSYGYEIREYPPVRNKKPGTTAVITEGLPIRGLPGGSYELSVDVKDIATGRTTTAKKRVLLIYAFNQLTPTMSSPDSFSIDDAKLMEQVIRFITTKEEKETYAGLNLEGKKAWLQSFWDRRNPEPGSPINKFKNEIFRRFIYANYFFSNSLIKRSDGWNSDRGRVYITYGQPDQIESFPSQMGQKPYEKWHYFRLANQSGGNYFYFVDETGYGNFRLVSSNVNGEISNPEYEQKLEQSASQ